LLHTPTSLAPSSRSSPLLFRNSNWCQTKIHRSHPYTISRCVPNGTTSPDRHCAKDASQYKPEASLIEHSFEISSSVYHAENENIPTFDAVHDDVLAHGDASRPGTEILIARSSCVREGGEKIEPGGNRVNQARRNIHAAAFLGDIKPDVVQVGYRTWRNTMRH